MYLFLIAFEMFLPTCPSRKDQKSEGFFCPLIEKNIFSSVLFLAVFVYALVTHVTLVMQQHIM